MAHKGKRYKLWFRRDLAVTLNDYSQAYPEAFVLDFTGISSTFFHVDQLRDTLIYNTRKDDTTIRRWTGDQTTGPGIRMRAEVEVIDDPPSFPKKYRFRIFVRLIFRVLELEFDAAPTLSSYETLGNDTQPTVLIKDTDIDLDMSNLQVICTAAPYARYNP